MTLNQRRQAGQRFMKQVLKDTGPYLKGSGWRRNSAWIYRVEGTWYLSAFVSGGTCADGMKLTQRVELGIKPMAVDPIYWRAETLHSNLEKPASFRSRAAFKTPSLPVGENTMEGAFPETSEAAEWCVEQVQLLAAEALEMVADRPFSDVVTSHPDASRYQALLWATLVDEGRGEEALNLMRSAYDDAAFASELCGRWQSVIDGTDEPGTSNGIGRSYSIYGVPIQSRQIGPLPSAKDKIEPKPARRSWYHRLFSGRS